MGGLYRNTRFEEFAEGCSEERYGPFDNYDEAEKEWHSRSWRRMDNCRVFYRIVDATPHPWVRHALSGISDILSHPGPRAALVRFHSSRQVLPVFTS